MTNLRRNGLILLVLLGFTAFTSFAVAATFPQDLDFSFFSDILLDGLNKITRNEKENVIPHLIECAKAYVSMQEVCDVFRAVFGVYKAPSIL